jgi:pyrroline-5-carboxylate reductase
MQAKPATIEERGTAAVGLVGGGFMGEAIVTGLVKAGVARPQDLCVAEAVEDRRRFLGSAHEGLRVVATASEGVKGCAAVVLAVKPQDFARVAEEVRPALQPDQVVISIMAGVRLATLADGLGRARVVRVMPNTPAALSEGFSTWIAADDVDEEQRALTRRILGALGREAEVHEERYLDMATAVSGSGPAYVFLFLEALINAGVHIGMPRALATEMVVQTVRGSVAMAAVSDMHLAALRDAVTSPGGTTSAALQVLERSGFRGTLTDAVTAAFEQSRALGG